MFNKKNTRAIARADLYERVWQMPMRTLAAEFGVSDVGLRKICKRNGIPVPPAGHWMKLQFGKKVRRLPLPPRTAGQHEEITINESPQKVGAVDLPQEIAEAIERERAGEPITVSKSPNPHPIVQSWGQAKQPTFGPPSFTPTAEARRRRIATVLFREIEKRGGKITYERFDLKCTLFGQTLEVTLREKLTQIRVPLSDSDRRLGWNVQRGYNTELRPSGLLQFRIDNYLIGVRREWAESEAKPLETRIREIIIGLYIAAAKLQRQAEEREEWHRQRIAEEQRIWQIEEQRRKEREQVKALIDEVNAWEQANRIRAYVRARSCSNILESTSDWESWAKAVADKIDPLVAPSQDGREVAAAQAVQPQSRCGTTHKTNVN